MGSNETLTISECHLPEKGINSLWPKLEFEPSSGIETAVLRQGVDEEYLLVLHGDGRNMPELETDLPVNIVHASEFGEVLLAGDNTLTLEVLGREFQVSAGSFFQVNTRQAKALVKWVCDHISTSPGTVLADVYCGGGLFSAFLAPRVRKLIGIELSESACVDFIVNMDEFDNVDLYVGAAEQVLPALQIKPDVILVDPPRAGLAPSVKKAIVASGAGQILYVSCDPSTLARDLKELVGNGYEVQVVQPFDMFSQTYHVESVVLMSKIKE